MYSDRVTGGAVLLTSEPPSDGTLSRTIRDRRRRSGQSIIESCLVIAIIALIFMGLLQVSQVFAAREILHHAAARGARAKTVGFNHWMVTKAIRVASIPVAGQMMTPAFENVDPQLRTMVNTLRPGELWDGVLRETEPTSTQAHLELSRIPDYMYSENPARAAYILDYEGWDTLGRADISVGNMIQIVSAMDYRLWVPMHRTFYADDSVRLAGESRIESHYPIYLHDLDL